MQPTEKDMLRGPSQGTCRIQKQFSGGMGKREADRDVEDREREARRTMGVIHWGALKGGSGVGLATGPVNRSTQETWE